MVSEKNNEIKIRKMGFFDTFRVISMHRNLPRRLKEDFTPLFIKSTLLFIYSYLANKITAFIAIDKKKVVGFAYITNFRKNNLGILVLKKYRKRGLGSKLLKRLLETRKETYLQVYEDNKVALKMYKKEGFKTIRRVLMMKK